MGSPGLMQTLVKSILSPPTSLLLGVSATGKKAPHLPLPYASLGVTRTLVAAFSVPPLLHEMGASVLPTHFLDCVAVLALSPATLSGPPTYFSQPRRDQNIGHCRASLVIMSQVVYTCGIVMTNVRSPD